MPPDAWLTPTPRARKATWPHTSPVRILYLIDYYYGVQGGTERQLLELLAHLDRRRFDPRLAVFRSTSFVQEHCNLPCQVDILSAGRLRSPRTWLALLRLTRLIRQDGIRLVHIFFNDASLAAPVFCRVAGARVVASRRDMGFWYTDLTLRILRISNRFVDAIIANSEAVARNVQRLEAVPRQKTVVIYNGHDPSRFEQPPLPNFRSSFSIPDRAALVGCVANLYPRKRHRDLIEAFALVRRERPATHLAIVGSGPMRAELQLFAHAAGVGDAVSFIEGVSDVVPLLKHFDLAVLCSETEGCSNTLIEYLGCARPTVCTNVGGNPEVVVDGVTGLLVDVGDTRKLAERICWLLAHPVQAKTLGLQGRASVLERFTTRRMIDSHMRLYERLLSRHTEA